MRDASHNTLLRSLYAWLSAIDGTPSIMPVIAPPTVPENTVSMPRFNPRFTPDSSSCGAPSVIRWQIPITAQSPGVPEMPKRRSPCRLTRSA